MKKKQDNNWMYISLVIIVALVAVVAVIKVSGIKSVEKRTIAGNAFRSPSSNNINSYNNQIGGHYEYGYFEVYSNETNDTDYCDPYGDNYDAFETGGVSYWYEKWDCSDSDNGISPYIFGNVNSSNGSVRYDYCLSNNTLVEWACDDGFVNYKIGCELGCSNGVCINKTDNGTTLYNLSNCTDSDGGFSVYTYGHVTDKNGYTLYDKCASDKELYERECLNNGDYNTVLITCDGTCDDGRCKPSENFIIKYNVDSDDYCSGDYLYEYSCSKGNSMSNENDRVTVTYGKCSLGCETDSTGKGKCVEKKWVPGYNARVPYNTGGQQYTN